MDNELLTTAQAAERLSVSVRRVQKLIQAGRLPANRLGRDYVILAADLESFAALERPTGYPKDRPRR